MFQQAVLLRASHCVARLVIYARKTEIPTDHRDASALFRIVCQRLVCGAALSTVKRIRRRSRGVTADIAQDNRVVFIELSPYRETRLRLVAGYKVNVKAFPPQHIRQHIPPMFLVRHTLKMSNRFHMRLMDSP